MKERLRVLAESIPNFESLNHADRLLFFAWFLQCEGKKDRLVV